MAYKDPARQREYLRAYALTHREQRRRIHHRFEWKAAGLDLGICESVYSSTDRCDICRTPFESKMQKNLDHDHNTKQVRGVLCANCNFAIGLFRDRPALLSRAIDYLAKDRPTEMSGP